MEEHKQQIISQSVLHITRNQSFILG